MSLTYLFEGGLSHLDFRWNQNLALKRRAEKEVSVVFAGLVLAPKQILKIRKMLAKIKFRKGNLDSSETNF